VNYGDRSNEIKRLGAFFTENFKARSRLSFSHQAEHDKHRISYGAKATQPGRARRKIIQQKQ